MYMVLTTILMTTMIVFTWCEIGHMLISRLFDHFVLLSYPSLQSSVSFFLSFTITLQIHILWRYLGLLVLGWRGELSKEIVYLFRKSLVNIIYIVIVSKTSGHLVEQGESEC